MRLIICGNGFDLHHRLPTAYSDYRRFLDENYPDLVPQILSSDYFDGCITEDDFWTDVEKNLFFSYEQMLEDSREFYPNVNSESFRDSEWHAMEVDSEEKIKDFDGSFTENALEEWIKSIDVSLAKKMSDVNALSGDLYVTFNYTETLEKIYNIHQNNILHIHGCVNKSTLQFGNPEQTPQKVKNELEKQYGDDEFYEASIKPAVENYVSMAGKFSKNLVSNLPVLNSFLISKNVDEVVIMGHSYLGVDKFYYEQVFVPKFKTAKWTIYCRDVNDVKRAVLFYNEQNLRGKVKIWHEKGGCFRRFKALVYALVKGVFL